MITTGFFKIFMSVVKIVISIMTAAVIAISTTSCSVDLNSTKKKTMLTVNGSENSSADSLAEGKTSDTEEDDIELYEKITGEITEDEALEIAKKAYDAIMQSDAAGIVAYTNVDYFWYLAAGEWEEDSFLVQQIQDSVENADESELPLFGYSSIQSLQFKEVTPLSESDIEELNEFVIIMTEDEAKATSSLDYKITNGYEIEVETDSSENSGEAEDTAYVTLIQVNGEWKYDLCIAIMLELSIQEASSIG